MFSTKPAASKGVLNANSDPQNQQPTPLAAFPDSFRHSPVKNLHSPKHASALNRTQVLSHL